MTSTRVTLATVVAVALLMSACGAGPADESGAEVAATDATVTTSLSPVTPAPTAAPTTTKAPASPTTTSAAPDFQPGDDPVAFVIADLAAALSVAEGDVVVVSQENVMWRDGSIGCPQPGFSYTQALVDGVRIVLDVDGDQYEYHSGGGRAPFLCLNPGS